MVSSDFTRLEVDFCCYSKWIKNSYIMLLLHVDDMLITASSMKEIVKLKVSLAGEFSIKNLGLSKKILGIRISRERKDTFKSITGRVREEDAEEV